VFRVDELKEKEQRFLDLKNAVNSTSARISLDEGGSIEGLKFDNEYVIKLQPNFKYKDSYASSILFPFANRIEKGQYSFKEKDYQLACNESGKNALHGLVHNKQFQLIEKIENINFSSVTICFEEIEEREGFPFNYKIYITYTLSKNKIKIAVKIENTGTNSFPFTLGWHPYFVSKDLYHSSLSFKSNKKIEFDKNLITKGIIKASAEELKIKIQNKQLDDCFILNSNTIKFITPTYQIQIATDQIENYLQIYTPKNSSIIALEPMTGISNSFNNKIGLQTLEPHNKYELKWTVNFSKIKTKNE
jgi:aldose 1-epimerase